MKKEKKAAPVKTAITQLLKETERSKASVSVESGTLSSPKKEVEDLKKVDLLPEPKPKPNVGYHFLWTQQNTDN